MGYVLILSEKLILADFYKELTIEALEEIDYI